MAIFDLFSKRQKALKGDVPDVYTYGDLPNPLRVQIVHIWADSIGNKNAYWHRKHVGSVYESIVGTLCREYGLFQLPTANQYGERMYLDELVNFFLQERDVDKQLDIVELSFKVIDTWTR